MRRILLWLIVIGAIAVSLVYWRDPLLWRRYAGFFIHANDPGYMNLQPTETVSSTEPFDLPRSSEDTLTISANALRTVEAYTAEFDSYALIVVHRGRVQTEWYNDGWRRDRLTQSQSMHKSVLPILIRAAVEDGDIGSVDDPIGRHVIEWQGDARGDITIRQLMMMSSGLGQYGFNFNPLSDDFQWLFGSDTTPVVLRTPYGEEPGNRFDYNNINSELLGLITERATGKRYATYLQEKLWQPMGGQAAQVWLDQPDGAAHTSCCLLASAMDWAKFGVMMLDRGTINGNRIVDAWWIDQMVKTSPTSQWYGLQIWLGYSNEPNPRPGDGGYGRTEPFLSDDTYYASGYGGQRIYVVPSHDLVIVRMGPFGGRDPLKDNWDNSYLVNTVIRGIDG